MQFIGTKSDLLSVKFNESDSFKIIKKYTQDVGLIDPLEFNNRIKNFNHNLLYEFTITRGIGYATKSKRNMKFPIIMTLSTLAVIGIVSFRIYIYIYNVNRNDEEKKNINNHIYYFTILLCFSFC